MKNLHDQKIEESVLGSIMAFDDVWTEISDLFFPELFTNPNYINISKCIVSLKQNSKPVDYISVSSDMKLKDYFNSEFQQYQLIKLTDNIASSVNTETYLRILQQYWLKREVKKIAEKTIQSTTAFNSDIFDIIDDYEVNLTKITERILTTNFKTPQELFLYAKERNKNILSRKGALSGITSGFRVIDEITGGWQKATLTILGSAPAMGKTSLALEFAKRPALQGIPIGFFSLEMSNEQTFDRMLSSESNIELEKISKKGLSDWEMKTLETNTINLRKAPIYFEDSNMDIFQLRNKARKLKQKYGIELLIIDYLQLVKSNDHKGNRSGEVSFVSRSLKGLAKELNIPIIAISALLVKEIAKRADKLPQLSDLKESGDIESDADLIMLLYRPEYYGIDSDDQGNSTHGKCMCLIEKHRQGALAKPMIGFEGRLTKFYSIGVDEPSYVPTPLESNINF